MVIEVHINRGNLQSLYLSVEESSNCIKASYNSDGWNDEVHDSFIVFVNQCDDGAADLHNLYSILDQRYLDLESLEETRVFNETDYVCRLAEEF